MHVPSDAISPDAPVAPRASGGGAARVGAAPKRIVDATPARPLLDAPRLADFLSAAGTDFGLTVVSEIDSTNAALVRVARARTAATAPTETSPTSSPDSPTEAELAEVGRRWRQVDAPRGHVLVAERQVAGRGRLDRSWESRVGAGLTVSLLVRPMVEPARLGWLPMVVGTALVSAVRRVTGVTASLKWPNDLLVDGAKLAGILVELVPAPAIPPAAVIGFGLNVHAQSDELPPRSTSLSLCGAPTSALDRTTLLGELLTELAGALVRWERDPMSARADYLAVCATIGRRVRVELPGGRTHLGTAMDVDAEGRLVVDGHPFSAGDVVHLR